MALTRHLIVSGRVQGVGFRDGLRAEALALQVTGWVRNRRDGTVEAVIQGEPDALDALVAWARRGPPAARVTHLVVEPAAGDFDRPYAGFDWLPTA
ncbi:MAG: acylphosphatase [Pseudomonadota bacterium]